MTWCYSITNQIPIQPKIIQEPDPPRAGFLIYIRRNTLHAETLKHVSDVVVIPAGTVTAAMHLIGVVNGVLTMVVLGLTVIYTAYRIYDLHHKRRSPS